MIFNKAMCLYLLIQMFETAVYINDIHWLCYPTEHHVWIHISIQRIDVRFGYTQYLLFMLSIRAPFLYFYIQMYENAVCIKITNGSVIQQTIVSVYLDTDV